MKNFKFAFFALLLAFSLNSIEAQAATKIYKDTYTQEDESGTWTFTGTKTNVYEITTTAGTTSSVTTARTGGVWVLGPTAGAIANGQWVLTLPTAASGLSYTFSTATNQTLKVRTASASDVIYYSANPCTALTSPASTGTTITVNGTSGAWYLTNMSATPWTPGSR